MEAINLGHGVAMSASQAELAAGLHQAQRALRSAEKNQTNPHLRNRYADLESVITAGRRAMADAGLSLTCHPVTTDGQCGVVYVLAHTSGQWRSGQLLLPMPQARSMQAAQAAGACLSYAHRYVRQCLLGIPSGEDTDGSTDEPAPQPGVDRGSPAWRKWQASLREGEHPLDYDLLAHWCQAHQRPRPSAMSAHQHRQLAQWLDNGGRAVVLQWSTTPEGADYLATHAE
jgi:hypothetical protein